MQLKNIVRLYYFLLALTSGGMGFFMGVYSNFLRSANLDELQINLVNVCFFAVVTVCEIPTGLYADIFGRKSSFVISCFLEMTAFAVYGISRSFWGFILAETIGAIGITFASGAFEAWLKDSLKHTGEKNDLHKIISHGGVYAKISVIATAFVGGWIGDHGMNLPFFAASVFYLLTGILAWVLMEENYFIKSNLSFISRIKKTRDTWNTSVSFAKTDLNFRFVLMISVVQMFAYMAPNMEWQMVFSSLGLSNSWNGIIAGLINGAMITGVLLSVRLARHFKDEKIQIVFTQILTGIGIALAVSFTHVYPVVGFFLLHELGRGMSQPLMTAYTHKCITNDEERATIASFVSMVKHFGGTLGLLVSGLIAKYAGIPSAWVFSGIFLILATIWVANNHRGKTE